MSRETEGQYARISALVCAMLFVASGTNANDVLDLYGNDHLAPNEPAASAQGTASDERGSGAPLQRWFAKTPDGRVETGWARDGVREGEWTIQWPDGLSESGRYTEGERSGEWTVMHPDGRTEKGDYVDGRRHGLWTIGPIDFFGTHCYQLFHPSSLCFFQGVVDAERLFSLGTPVGPWAVRSGDILSFNWSAEGSHIDERGRLQGQWQVRWPDGTTARGLMLDSTRHGEWEVRNSIGTHARGAYCNGMRCGHWTIRWYDGVREQGNYCAVDTDGLSLSLRCEGWRVFWPDGTYEQGSYKKGRRHGEWTIVLPGSVVERGAYEQGQRHGPWKIEWPDGTSESGAFHRGKRSGIWIYRRGKDEASGRYEDGRVVGDWIYRFRLRRVKEYGEVIKEQCGKYDGYMCAPYGAMALSVRIEHWDILNRRQSAKLAYDDMEEVDGHVGTGNSLWIYYFADGGFETGQIIANKPSGHWIRWYPDGRIVEGRYTNGASQGRWRTRFPDGTVSSGEVGNHRMAHGRWQVRDPGSDVVEQGLFIAGKKEGLWESVPLDRGRSDGLMKADEPLPNWR